MRYKHFETKHNAVPVYIVHRAPVHLESYPGKDWPGSISS